EQVRVPASDPTAPAASAPNRRPKTKLVQMPGTRVPAADPDSPVPPQRNPVRLKKKIWDLENEGDEEAGVQAEPAMEPRAKKPRVPLRAPAEGGPNIAPPAGRPARGGRVKTRLIGFAHSDGATEDPFAKEKSSAQTTQALFPAGWLLLVDGPGRGNCFTLFTGVAQIGRGDDQQIRLDFGDSAISRQNHAAVAYDPEQRKFFLGHGGKSNLVRLNGKPVLSTEDLSDGDLIRIGETTLRFVALCGEHFTWDDADDEAQDDE
ncbi:MAG: FHA domain-containing protein, partial [Pseudomonadota bacterium]